MRFIKRYYSKILSNKHSESTENFKRSYSQCGEDLIIDYIFKLRGIKRPSYLDVGANDPYFLNNTALFYNSGSVGVNIDANIACINKFNVLRKNDINLNIGIGEKEDVKPFFILNDPTLSTFSELECQNYIKTGRYHVIETKMVAISTLDSIILDHFNGKFPELLTIDVEGLDFEIIKSINFNASYPLVICVEAAEYSPIGAGRRRDRMIDYLVNQGYYEYANTNLNAIMVKRDFWFI